MTNHNSALIKDPENREWWYMHGRNLEEQFVQLCNDQLDIRACINPEKITNPYVPDLIVNGRLSDLKTQNTPFFMASQYGLEPRYTYTFNRKDYERYKKHYPDIDIYVWIDWRQTAGFGKRVDYLGGFYRLPFCTLAQLIEAGAAEHSYLRRQDPSDRNAKSSFLLDIRHFEMVFDTDFAFSTVRPLAHGSSGQGIQLLI